MKKWSNKLGGNRRRSKYRNVRVSTKDGKFDSKGEMCRWLFLKAMLKDGKIVDLERQVAFSIDVNGQHICDYVADYTYTVTETGQHVVEDFKGAIITPEFRLKKKLMLAVHGIDVRITKAKTEPIN